MLTQTGFAIIVVGFFLVMQLAILIVGKIFGKLAMLVSISNILVAVSILSYWMLNQLCAPTHFIELRTSASYSLVLQHNKQALNVTQYVAFAIHLLCYISFIIFMLIFRINILF